MTVTSVKAPPLSTLDMRDTPGQSWITLRGCPPNSHELCQPSVPERHLLRPSNCLPDWEASQTWFARKRSLHQEQKSQSRWPTLAELSGGGLGDGGGQRKETSVPAKQFWCLLSHLSLHVTPHTCDTPSSQTSFAASVLDSLSKEAL